jgi:hypothetical protein
VTTASPPLLILFKELKSKVPLRWDTLEEERSFASLEIKKLGAKVKEIFWEKD